MKKLFSYLLISSMVVLSSCTNYDDQFDDLNTQINALKTQIAGFSSLSTGLTSLQGTVASLQSAVANIPATDLSGLESDLTDLSALVKALQAQVAATATALEAGTVSDAAIAAAIKVVQDNQAALDTAVAAVTAAQATLATAADVAAVTAAQTAADAAAVKLAAAVAGLATELTALGTTNAELKTVTDLIQASVTLLSSGQAANTKSIATLVDAVAALDTASLSTLINTLSTSVTSSTADILAAILAGNNVYTSGAGTAALIINSPSSLAVAESLGTKLGIINGSINITHTPATGMDAAKLQAVIDNITTVTGVITYTHSGSATAVNFSKLSSAGELDLNVEQAISLPELTTVTNEFGVNNGDKITSLSAPKLTVVGSFNGNNILALGKATSIDLTAMTSYVNASLTINGNTLSSGWDLTMPNIQSKSPAGIVRAFALSIGGVVNNVELDKMVYSGSTITANDAKKLVLDNFQGILTSGASTNHVNVELGSFKTAAGYTGGSKLETFKSTGVNLSTLATSVGPAYVFTSSTKLVSVEIAGSAGVINLDNNDSVETVTISADATSVDLTDSSSLTTVVISGDVDGTIDFTDSIALTSATISGDANKVDFDSNTSLTSVSLTGAYKEVIVEDADALTALDLAHTTAFNVARSSITPIAATAKSATLTVINNDELASLSADKVTLVGSLSVYGNPVLSSVSFDNITVPGALVTATTVQIGAIVGTTAITPAANNLHAQSKSLSDNVVVSASSTKRTGSITTNSGLADLATYLSAAVAKTGHNVAVLFDQVDSYTDELGNNDTDVTYSLLATAPNSLDSRADIVTVANSKNNAAGSTSNIYESEAVTISHGASQILTITANGLSKSYTRAATGETLTEFGARIADDNFFGAGKVQSGEIDFYTGFSVTATSTLVSTTLSLGSTTVTTGTITGSDRIVLNINSGTGSTTAQVATAIAASISGTIVQEYAAATGWAAPAVGSQVRYYAEADATTTNLVKVYKAKNMAASGSYAYVKDRTIDGPTFTIHGISGIRGTIVEDVPNVYVRVIDNAVGDADFDVTWGGQAAKTIAIVKTTLAGATPNLRINDPAAPYYDGGLTETSEYEGVDNLSDGRGYGDLTPANKLYASPVYVTTYWAWN